MEHSTGIPPHVLGRMEMRPGPSDEVPPCRLQQRSSPRDSDPRRIDDPFEANENRIQATSSSEKASAATFSRSAPSCLSSGSSCLPDKKFSVPADDRSYDDRNDVEQLVTAALHGNFETAKRLLDQNVDPKSEYSFWAGGRRIPWTGPIMFAAITKGHISILKLLLEYHADLGMCSKLKVEGEFHENTVFWDACNAGQLEIVRFLMVEKADVNREGINPDSEERVSPLHQAVIRGRCHVVEALLQVEQVNSTHKRSEMILEAIWSEHFDIVRAFVAQSGHFWLASARQRTDTSTSSGPSTPKSGLARCTSLLRGDLDLILESGDARAVHVTAQALQEADAAAISEVLDHERLCKFIGRPGAAPHEILNAVFRRRKIVYWEGSRKLRRTALLDPGAINVAIGPPAETFGAKFANVEPLTDPESEFIHRLLPHDTQPSTFVKNVMKAPVEVDVYASSIPGLHENPKILLSLLEVDDSNIFENHGCEALVRAFVRGAQSFVIMELVLSFLLAAFIFVLTGLHSTDDHPLWVRNTFLALSVACCVIQMCVEIVKLYGFSQFKRAWLYFTIREVPYRLLMTGVALQVMYWDWGSNRARICICVAAPINWMGVLEGLEYFSTVSQHSLPVKSAFKKSMPFFFVLFWPFVAMLNAYYALGVRTISEAVFLCYGLAFHGDFDRNELEGVDTSFEQDEAGMLVEQDTAPTNMRIPLTVFILVTSTIVTITLLNILIGVVTMHYERAHDNKKMLYLRNKATDTFAIVATLHAAGGMRRSIFGCCCASRRATAHRIAPHEEESQESEDPAPPAQYVWYCQHAATGDGCSKKAELMIWGHAEESRCSKKADVIEPAPPPPSDQPAPAPAPNARTQQEDLREHVQQLEGTVQSLRDDIRRLTDIVERMDRPVLLSPVAKLPALSQDDPGEYGGIDLT